MEKRFVAFLALAFAILMANTLVVNWLWPPPPKPERPPVAAQAEDQDQGTADAEPAADATDDLAAVPSDLSPREPRAEQPKPDLAPPAPQQEDPPERWVALGSLNPADGYRMLVVLTSRGAAIERLALSSRRYSNLENRSGYLGPLALEDVSGNRGCRVRVVGRGTPAAEAGLEADDVITAIGRADSDARQQVGSAVDLHKFLSSVRPKQRVVLAFEREGRPMPEVTASLRRRPLEVMRPERENLLDRQAEVPADLHDPPSLLLTPSQIGEDKLAENQSELEGVDLRTGNWQVVTQQADSVAFRRVLADTQLEFIKRYRLERIPEQSLSDSTYPGYGLTFELEIRNLASSAQEVAYRLDGPTGLPVEGWWYANKIGRTWKGVGLRDAVVRYENNPPQLFGTAGIADEQGQEIGKNSSLMFIGIDSQYFSSVLIPQKQQLDQVWYEETRALRVDPHVQPQENTRLVNVTCRMVSKPFTLEPAGDPLHHRFTLFAGPKVPGLLARYGQGDKEIYNLKDLVYYGWFGWVAKPMLAILHLFYGIVRNYGLAIIMLTVLVRGCMFPLSLKQTRNMQKMQELQPEMKRLAEKYKGDMEKRTKAQQDLFRSHNYNPMGGCMVMFVQLPIFLGLYRSLMVDVELRQAPLLGDAIRWCSNLAAPDMLWDWSALMPQFITQAQGIFGLGPYFNVLPIITIGLFILQQKMFMPPAADEQAAMQQKIMKYMMVFMGVLFFKVASGLCLYFIASSLWGVAERQLLPKAAGRGQPSPPEAKPPAERTGADDADRPARKKKRPKPKQRRR